MPFRIVAIGDSIIWGQGLLPAEKFTALVAQALDAAHPEGVTVESSAHSGAVIGATPATGSPQPGEVPAPRPTIIEQCDAFTNAPEDVDLVIMDGGINDVGVPNILNPLSLIPSLDGRVIHACHDGMLALLNKVKAKFTKPGCKIRVTGYYPILSSLSDPASVPRLLGLFGIAVPEFVQADADFINPIFDRCEAFFNDSTAQLKQAVAHAEDPRIEFVPSGFTDANSVFVPGTSLLWGLDLTHDLAPEDPAAAQRRPLCVTAHPDPQILPRELCFRASAGHPNVQGAIQFNRRVLASL